MDAPLLRRAENRISFKMFVKLSDPMTGAFEVIQPDIGAGARECETVRDCRIRIEVATAVRERVGRDVDHAHDQRPLHAENCTVS